MACARERVRVCKKKGAHLEPFVAAHRDGDFVRFANAAQRAHLR